MFVIDVFHTWFALLREVNWWAWNPEWRLQLTIARILNAKHIQGSIRDIDSPLCGF